MLGALDATAQGRPAEAERWAEAAERASYEGSLPDGSASIDSWRALLRAHALPARGGDDARGCGACGPDARALEPVPADALVLLRAVAAGWPARSTRPTTCLADVAEEGLELGAHEAVAVALGERAAVAIGRGAWVEAEEFADQALRVIRRSRMEEYPTSALAYALAARVALHRGKPSAPTSSSLGRSACGPRLTYAAPYFAVQTRLELARAYVAIADAGGAETMLREIDALAASPTRPRHAPGPGRGAARQPEDDAR